MDYENEALEQAKKELAACGSMDCDAARLIFRLFPQLRESEDERIRKYLIEELKVAKSVGELKFAIPQPTREDCIAYLEKQKERGPLTKDEEYILHRIIEYLEDETCPSEWISLLHDIYCLPYPKQKEQKPTPAWMPKFLDELRSKKNYFDWDTHRDIEGHILAIIKWIAPNYFKEKEQKQKTIGEYHKVFDELYGGYEPNLQPIKQKPAWSEEDEMIRNAILGFLNPDKGGTKYSSNAELVEWSNWLKSLRPQKKCSECSKHLEGYINGRADAEKKLLEQFGAVITPENELHMKPRWRPSEEQMTVFQNTMQRLLRAGGTGKWYSILKSLYEQLKKL